MVGALSISRMDICSYMYNTITIIIIIINIIIIIIVNFNIITIGSRNGNVVVFYLERPV